MLTLKLGSNGQFFAAIEKDSDVISDVQVSNVRTENFHIIQSSLLELPYQQFPRPQSSFPFISIEIAERAEE